MAKKAKSLDGRHRDTTGRIDRKHGNSRIGSLRKSHGEHFAKGRRKDMVLKTLLVETGICTPICASITNERALDYLSAAGPLDSGRS